MDDGCGGTGRIRGIVVTSDTKVNSIGFKVFAVDQVSQVSVEFRDGVRRGGGGIRGR